MAVVCIVCKDGPDLGTIVYPVRWWWHTGFTKRAEAELGDPVCLDRVGTTSRLDARADRAETIDHPRDHRIGEGLAFRWGINEFNLRRCEQARVNVATQRLGIRDDCGEGVDQPRAIEIEVDDGSSLSAQLEGADFGTLWIFDAQRCIQCRADCGGVEHQGMGETNPRKMRV